MSLFFKGLMVLLGSLLSARFAHRGWKLITIGVIVISFLLLAVKHIDYQSNASLRYWKFDGECFAKHGVVQLHGDKMRCVSFDKVIMEETL